jgi:superfamily I DNA and/or RNA helicase
VPAEGDALRVLLTQLIEVSKVAPETIFLISPFRDVVQQITRIGTQFGLKGDRMGTVHTTQGKEAEVVIVVVGGGSAGARDWTISKPNLLNVAVTRAKARLYLIGDRRDLAQRPHFDVLSRSLPVLVI